MRKSAGWMTIWDDRILEAIRAEGSGSPTPLSEHSHIHVQKSHISQRLKKLADYNLLEHLGNGVYIITPEGEKYLDGDLDATDLAYNDLDEER
ncbi:transcriptional regulator [Halorubrum halodurans]|uniref:Transcriptional regulator n=1 Tax=Halorubrum halodurans TaxID=1383851 RepID=A0A256IIZ1_9EURY|nr:transcriptional regulator [Halorubrum halodurans]